jgi:hypothetical protein
MATKVEKILKLEQEVTSMKDTLIKYHKLFMEDGEIDQAEEEQLKSMQEVIKKIEAKIASIKESDDFNIGVSDGTIDKKIDYEYTEIVADLFKKGRGDDHKIHPNDVRQGYLGDCYFLAAIQAIAQSDPGALEKLIKDNGDGTYEVTLYVYKTFISWNRSPVKITVDATVPTYKGGTNPVYAGKGDNELWVLLLEKAYAKYKGDYGDIEGGNPSKAMGVLLSEDGSDFDTDDFTDEELKAKIKAALDGNKAITASSNSKTKKKESVTVDGQLIYYSHAYNLLSLTGDEVYLQNPHGANHVRLSISDFKKYYRKISVQ